MRGTIWAPIRRGGGKEHCLSDVNRVKIYRRDCLGPHLRCTAVDSHAGSNVWHGMTPYDPRLISSGWENAGTEVLTLDKCYDRTTSGHYLRSSLPGIVYCSFQWSGQRRKIWFWFEFSAENLCFIATKWFIVPPVPPLIQMGGWRLCRTIQLELKL